MFLGMNDRKEKEREGERERERERGLFNHPVTQEHNQAFTVLSFEKHTTLPISLGVQELGVKTSSLHCHLFSQPDPSLAYRAALITRPHITLSMGLIEVLCTQTALCVCYYHLVSWSAQYNPRAAWQACTKRNCPLKACISQP